MNRCQKRDDNEQCRLYDGHQTKCLFQGEPMSLLHVLAMKDEARISAGLHEVVTANHAENQRIEAAYREELFKTVEWMTLERNQATDMLTAVQERLAEYLEVARCAKAVVAFHYRRESNTNPKGLAHLAQVIETLEAGVGAAALLTPPTTVPPVPPRFGSDQHIASVADVPLYPGCK
jgi:hypothetical protein